MRDDLHNPLLNLIRYGVIASVDVAARRAVVTVGGNTTTPLPWIAGRAGDMASWSAPTQGEQVLVLAPGGNLAAAVILRGIYSDVTPAPSVADEKNAVIAFPDGCVLVYDFASHQLSATLPEGATAQITVPGGLLITGDVKIAGNLAIDGATHSAKNITSDSDVLAGAISLKGHKHPGVQTGSGVTGAPQ